MSERNKHTGRFSKLITESANIEDAPLSLKLPEATSRFMSRIRVEDNGCWTWIGGVFKEKITPIELGETSNVITKKTGVHKMTISAIKTGRQWRHIT
jgi:hypothetical protein